jgi:hypothetical protein
LSKNKSGHVPLSEASDPKNIRIKNNKNKAPKET